MENFAQDSPSNASTPATAEATASLPRTLLRVAWLAVLLGFVIEGLVLFVAGSQSLKTLRPILADLAQKISWSTIVCVGLALGKGASRLLRTPLTGLAGLLAAPAAFAIAKTFHEGIAEVLAIPPKSATAIVAPTPMMLAVMKGVEYGFLGLALGWIGSRAWSGYRSATAHLATGLTMGVVFGVTILILAYTGSTPRPTQTELITRGVNEILHPLGCAMVLFGADVLGRDESR